MGLSNLSQGSNDLTATPNFTCDSQQERSLLRTGVLSEPVAGGNNCIGGDVFGANLQLNVVFMLTLCHRLNARFYYFKRYYIVIWISKVIKQLMWVFYVILICQKKEALCCV